MPLLARAVVEPLTPAGVAVAETRVSCRDCIDCARMGEMFRKGLQGGQEGQTPGWAVTREFDR